MPLPSAATNRMDALTVVAALSAAAASAVLAFILSLYAERVDQLDTDCHAIQIEQSKMGERITARDLEKTYFIAQILENEKRGDETDRRVIRLETKPEARADQFTGTQGARLEKMIRELRTEVDTKN